MDVTGPAVGIASLGIGICQGLLSYYDSWNAYKTNISGAYESIENLGETFVLLQDTLGHRELEPERARRAKECLQSCKDGLDKLEKKLHKLRTYTLPNGLRQKVWSELQRAYYPFRASTLAKLKEIADELRDQLSLATQALQLELSVRSQETLTQVAVWSKDTAARSALIETSITQLSVQHQSMLTGVQSLLAVKQSDEFRKIVEWLSPPNPWTNHASARQRHEAQTGTWLLQSDQYRKWRTGSTSCLWLYGKAGCGKTVLCSTVVEDIQAQYENNANIGHAVFYFSFSDSQKQSYESLLRSLVAQLGWKEPGLSKLLHASEKPNPSLPGPDELEKILLSTVGSYNEVYLSLDALDECPEDGDVRQNVLQCLERLSQKAPNLRVVATSRYETSEVRESMEILRADPISITARSVDADIRKYVTSQLSRDRKLCRLDTATKELIEETISQKADGMFRWAYCQLQELKKVKSTKPKYVKEVLRTLPATLDETYKRMLIGIEKKLREEALVLLRSLAYAQSPPSLSELAEASIIDPTGDGTVDISNRGRIEDTLDILSGLVIVDSTDDNDNVNKDLEAEVSESEDSQIRAPASTQPIGRDTKIKLAHFSVQEYLESDRILQSDAKDFYLESDKEHGLLSRSCVSYILYYSSSSSGKTSTQKDLEAFPMLRYAAESWFYHSLLQQSGDISHEISLLSSQNAIYDWLLVHQPDRSWNYPFQGLDDIGSGLYYASLLGLRATASELLSSDAKVNAQGGEYNTALQAASAGGHENVVRMLIDAGADVNSQGGEYSTALQAASVGGHKVVVEILVEKGADVNTQVGFYSTALQAASARGYEKVVEMLIEKDADVKIQGGLHGTALQAASAGGYEKIVEILIEKGADVKAQEGFYGTALQAASDSGHEVVVEMLIKKGADVKAQGGFYGTALQAASVGGYEKVAEMLIEKGADVNTQGGEYSTALQAASVGGHEKMVGMLIEKGADVNTQGGFYGTALQAALAEGHEKVVGMLIEKGASRADGNCLQRSDSNE